MLRRLVALSLILGLLACGGAGGNAVNPAWDAYRQAALKILSDYDLAMRDVATIDTALVDLTGGTPKINTDTAVSQLETVVIPKLGRVADAASKLQTPDYPTLTEAHKPLVNGLSGKVIGYKQMIEAYKKRDASSFDAALKILLTSDATVKRYRADFQRWTEQGDVTLTVAATPAPVPSGTPDDALKIPGVLVPPPPQ